ncbi:MAG: amidohydrolase family protein [Candidatus Pacebacteria bacterium]|nr:amidohydrolase family protein [Candidatus Paceibacterota bacterium]
MLIDVHGHIGRVLPDRREFIDAVNLIAKMDAWGIAKTCVLALSEHPEGAYLESDTEDVLAACGRYPDRLIPFCLIDPRYGNRPDMDFSHLLEEYTARGCKGLGEFLPKLDFDDQRCLNLYRQAGDFGLPVLFDMQDRTEGYGLRDDYGLPRLEHALQNCPDTVFVGHGPTFWAEISADVPADQRAGYPKGPVAPGGAVPRLMRTYPNLWADISAGSGYNAMTRDPSFGIEFLDEFQDKLMFGTDSCKRSDVDSVYPNVAFVRELRDRNKLPEDAIEKIEWRNAAQLLDVG